MKAWIIGLIAAAISVYSVITYIVFVKDDDQKQLHQGCYISSQDIPMDTKFEFNPPPQCIQKEPCDHETQYWNELACQCFSKGQCKMGCGDGMALHPGSMCECVEESVVQDLYPDCASQENIENAEVQGLQAASERPQGSNSVICPRDDYLPESWCDGTMMWNELACECYSPVNCMIMCPDWQELDPRTGCDCIDKLDLRADLYPSWASQYDIDQANRQMNEAYSEYMDKMYEISQCPHWQHQNECDQGFYWNELACQCFSAAQCLVPCPDGQFNMPTEECGCTANEQDFLDLFPERATAEQIELSEFDGLLRYNEKL